MIKTVTPSGARTPITQSPPIALATVIASLTTFCFAFSVEIKRLVESIVLLARMPNRLTIADSVVLLSVREMSRQLSVDGR